MKIAIYYPDLQTFSVRDGRTETNSFMLPYTGLRKVVSEIKGHEIFSAWGNKNFDADVCLYSLISFYDFQALPLLRKLTNAKIIVGGASCINVRGAMGYIDGAVFGRCDNGMINQIIDGDDLPGVWRKNADPKLQRAYHVNEAEFETYVDIFGNAQQTPESVGCPNHCAFCHYSHWHKYKSSINKQAYNSGVGKYEDFFLHLPWESCARGGVSAIDGGNESTRLAIGKSITKQAIVEKLSTINDSSYAGLHRLKLYNIYGYPWENPDSYDFDFSECASIVDKEIHKQLTVKIQSSHFIPFYSTPMQNMAFNWKAFNQTIKKYKFDGRNIKIYPGTYSQSPRLAALSTIIQRATKTLPGTFFSKKIWTMDHAKLHQYYNTEIKNKFCNLENVANHPNSNIIGHVKKFGMTKINIIMEERIMNPENFMVVVNRAYNDPDAEEEREELGAWRDELEDDERNDERSEGC